MKKYFVFFAVIATALILSSCGKVPQAEIDTAFAAIDQAKQVQADLYVSEDFSAVQDSMNSINAEIEAQKSKMFKNFDEVIVKLTAVTSNANELLEKTEAKKEEIKTEVLSAQTTISTLLEESNIMVQKAPTGKEGKAALEAIKSDLGTITNSASEVQALVDSGDLLGAQTKAAAAMQKANDINTEIKTVLSKYSRK